MIDCEDCAREGEDCVRDGEDCVRDGEQIIKTVRNGEQTAKRRVRDCV